jgi:hypothetical protein
MEKEKFACTHLEVLSAWRAWVRTLGRSEKKSADLIQQPGASPLL